MTGRCYYITSLPDWRRHAAHFANSHWIALVSETDEAVHERARPATADLRHAVSLLSGECPGQLDAAIESVAVVTNAVAPAPDAAHDGTRVLVLVEADEGVHLALEDDSAFEALPHPLAQKTISDAAHSALAAHGVAAGATTFDVTEIIARAHPLLRHRVF